jgi:hypothetical protein
MMLLTRLNTSSGMVAVPSVDAAPTPPSPPPDIPNAVVVDHVGRSSQLPAAAAAREEVDAVRRWTVLERRGGRTTSDDDDDDDDDGTMNASALTNAAIGMTVRREAALTLMFLYTSSGALLLFGALPSGVGMMMKPLIACYLTYLDLGRMLGAALHSLD